MTLVQVQDFFRVASFFYQNELTEYLQNHVLTPAQARSMKKKSLILHLLKTDSGEDFQQKALLLASDNANELCQNYFEDFLGLPKHIAMFIIINSIKKNLLNDEFDYRHIVQALAILEKQANFISLLKIQEQEVENKLNQNQVMNEGSETQQIYDYDIKNLPQAFQKKPQEKIIVQYQFNWFFDFQNNECYIEQPEFSINNKITAKLCASFIPNVDKYVKVGVQILKNEYTSIVGIQFNIKINEVKIKKTISIPPKVQSQRQSSSSFLCCSCGEQNNTSNRHLFSNELFSIGLKKFNLEIGAQIDFVYTSVIRFIAMNFEALFEREKATLYKLGINELKHLLTSRQLYVLDEDTVVKAVEYWWDEQSEPVDILYHIKWPYVTLRQLFKSARGKLRYSVLFRTIFTQELNRRNQNSDIQLSPRKSYSNLNPVVNHDRGSFMDQLSELILTPDQVDLDKKQQEKSITVLQDRVKKLQDQIQFTSISQRSTISGGVAYYRGDYVVTEGSIQNNQKDNSISYSPTKSKQNQSYDKNLQQ